MGAQYEQAPLSPRPQPRSGAEPLALARRAAELARDKKGEDLILLDLSSLGAVSDFFLIVTGNSEVQVKAIAEHVIEQLKLEGQVPWHTEGFSNRRWILLDYVDVVVHVFYHETRDYYLLERLWGDARRVSLPGE